MTTQSMLLAGAALFALAGPAAAGDGLYVGLGVGWDNQNNIGVVQFAPPLATGQVSTNDGVTFAGTIGYKLPEFPIRLEFESGYDWHSVNNFTTGGTTYGAAGHANIASELVNAIYDFPVGPGWNIYGGAGVGAGHVYFAPYISDTAAQIAHVDHWGFMWQAIGGVSFEVAPDAEIFVDYRYRDAEAAHQLTYTPVFGPVGAHDITENVVMAGVRFYMFPAEVAAPPAYAPPPPAPYYNQPAPPPPPQPENPAPTNNPSGGATSGGAGGPP
jgi:opacity protein-like surface antigen